MHGLREFRGTWFLGYISYIDVMVCMCYGTIVMHNVVVCILLAIYNYDVVHVESVLPFLKTLGGTKCCVRFSVPRNSVVTLSFV